MQKTNISAHVVVNMSSLVALRLTPYSFISFNNPVTGCKHIFHSQQHQMADTLEKSEQ